MTITISKYTSRAVKKLKNAGYTKLSNGNGYIKQITKMERFHAIIINDRQINFHIDIVKFECKDNDMTHWSIGSHDLLKEERKRIKN